MNTELLGKMLDAGFTKDEILSLVGTEPKPDPVPDPEPVPNPEPDPAPDPAPDPEPNPTPDPDPMEKRLDGIESKIADLVKAMQLNNLKNDSMKNTPETVEQNADRALTEIIRPPRHERGK